LRLGRSRLIRLEPRADGFRQRGVTRDTHSLVGLCVFQIRWNIAHKFRHISPPRHQDARKNLSIRTCTFNKPEGECRAEPRKRETASRNYSRRRISARRLFIFWPEIKPGQIHIAFGNDVKGQNAHSFGQLHFGQVGHDIPVVPLTPGEGVLVIAG